MDRVIVYPGAIPLETDLLSTNRNAMVGLGKLAAAMLGSSTLVHGLGCTPTSPASLQVYVAPGQIYALESLDATAYSSLAADTTHQIMKQGVLLDQATLNCPAPGTAGYSVNYLVQAAYLDSDAGSAVLPYYNASNPTQAYAGPNNTGTSQDTERNGVCNVNVKAGTAATTGTQTTPSPDAGYIGLYVVTVANGQTQITSANITKFANAPILPTDGVLGGLLSGDIQYADDSGTVNAYVVNRAVPAKAYTDGMVVAFSTLNANTVTNPYVNVDGLGNVLITQPGGSALVVGQIQANTPVFAVYNSAGPRFELQGGISYSQGDARYVVQTAQGYKPPVGTMLMWPLPTAPSWAVARDGSALSRSAYGNLFGVLCPTRNGTTDGSTNALTGLSTTVDMYVGMPIEGTGIPAGTTVASITSSSAVTMSNASTAAGTVPVTLFYYGYGSAGGSTTFGVPDDRGVFERGLDTGAAVRDALTYTCTNTSGTAVITGLASTVGMSIGMALSGTGVPGGATILSINSATQITMSANSTSAVSSLTVTGNRIGAYQSDQFASHFHAQQNTTKLNAFSGTAGYGTTGTNMSLGGNTQYMGNAETKPKNRAYLPIIVY